MQKVVTVFRIFNHKKQTEKIFFRKLANIMGHSNLSLTQKPGLTTFYQYACELGVKATGKFSSGVNSAAVDQACMYRSLTQSGVYHFFCSSHRFDDATLPMEMPCLEASPKLWGVPTCEDKFRLAGAQWLSHIVVAFVDF